MALSLEQLQAAFKKSEPTNNSSRPNNYYPFWNMKVGDQAVIRFLPDKNSENPLGFMVEKLTHNLVVNGEKKTIACRKMHNEDCAICKVSSAYYKDNDKTNGKKYWRKKQHIAQVLVVEDPLPANEESGESHQGKLRYVAFGYQLFEVIKTALLSGELDENPYSFTDGYNFVIKKTKQGEYDTYAIGSRFKSKASSLAADDIEELEGQLVDLTSLLPKDPGAEQVEAILQAALTGADYVAGNNSSNEESEPLLVKKATASVPLVEEEATPVKTANVTSAKADADSDETDDEAERILAQIRNRRANKA